MGQDQVKIGSESGPGEGVVSREVGPAAHAESLDFQAPGRLSSDSL